MAEYIPGELAYHGQGYEDSYNRRGQDDYNSKFSPELINELNAPIEEDEEEEDNG